jgi:type IV pilus assembly protein PilQ
MLGGRMNRQGLKQGLGIFLSISMVSDPLFAAFAPMAPAGMDSASVSGSVEDRAAQTAASASQADNSFKSTFSTNNLPLPRTPISMDFQDADVRDVMHLMAVKSGINIIYGSDVIGPVTVHLDRVPFDQAFQTVLMLKGLVALPVGPRIIRVISSVSLTQEQSQATTFTKVFVLKYSIATDVKTPLDAIRSAAGRKGVSTVDVKNNALIITDTIQGLKEVEDLIPSLDRKPQQVDIEAKVVEVTLDNDTKLGVSWAFSKGGGGENNLIGKTASTTPGFGISGAAGMAPNGPGASGGGTGVDFASGLGSLAQSAFTFLHQEQAWMLQAQLTALASKQKVKILSTPHIVAMNNMDATINVVNQIPYQVSTVSNGIASNSVSFVEAGVKLTVKPTVNADRRITLKVKPEVSNPNNAPSAFSGAPPQINTRNAETTVLLRDGETIAIGGLITETTTKNETGIPILMSIPIVGWLFKGKEDRVQRTELIVFLTPKIAAE